MSRALVLVLAVLLLWFAPPVAAASSPATTLALSVRAARGDAIRTDTRLTTLAYADLGAAAPRACEVLMRPEPRLRSCAELTGETTISDIGQATDWAIDAWLASSSTRSILLGRWDALGVGARRVGGLWRFVVVATRATLLPGIDISTFNRLSPRTFAGQRFVIVRATYGPYRDDQYRSHVAAARRAGLPVGAYHFGVRWVDVRVQVRMFLAVAADADWLVLDLEGDGPRPRMTDAQAREWIGLVKRLGGGRKVLLYHSRSGFPSLGQDANWVAQYGRPNARFGRNPPTGVRWTLWQWQGSPLDRNWFRGDETDLRRFVGRR